MRVPYSVFKRVRTEVVRAYTRSVEGETHVPGSSANLSQLTNNSIPFGPGDVWSERRRGTESSDRDLCRGVASGLEGPNKFK